MRLLLDADLSCRRIAVPLEERGHDVVALQTDPSRRSRPDELVLEWAATETRILVTRNARHFQPLARLWAEEERAHAGLILIWGFRSNAFAEIVAGIEEVLLKFPDAGGWRNLVLSIWAHGPVPLVHRLQASIDGSLERLGLDYVDLYQIHRWDPLTPIAETMKAPHDVVRAGKAR